MKRLISRSENLPLKPAIHFVGFCGDEYWSAVKVWGRPGFIHRGRDSRAVQDIHPDDTVIFAKGTEADPMPRFTYHDLDEL